MMSSLCVTVSAAQPLSGIYVAVQHKTNYRENPRSCKSFVALQQIIAIRPKKAAKPVER
jgi:hypothetical protein